MILSNMIGHSAQMRMRQRPRAGFTLVELFVVIFIAGLLMAIAMPRIGRTLQERYARNSRDAFAWAANRARARAIQTGTTFLLQLDPATERAWVVRRNATTAADTLTTIDFSGSEFNSTVTTPSNALMTVCYSPRGYAYNGTGCNTGTVDVTFTHGVYTAAARVKPLGQVERL